MTRDYKNITATRVKGKAKKKNTARKSSKINKPSGLSSKFVFFSVFIIATFILSLVYLKLNFDVDEGFSKVEKDIVDFSKPAEKKSDSVSDVVSGAVSGEAKEKSRFEFYNILPERNIEIQTGKDIVKKEAVEKKSVRKPPVEKNSSSKQVKVERANVERVKIERLYILQVGSYNRFKDADRQKANLAFIGVISRIHSVSQGNKTMFRVQVGPYDNLKKINKVASILKQNKIPSLLMKIKG